MNGEKARGLVPPRPNLGPEPWREPDSGLRFPLAVGGTAIALLLATWMWRSRVARRQRGAGEANRRIPAADLTPRDRLVGLSETIRDAMTAQFGSSFRAKTTEELSADERLVQLLGEEGFGDLMRFLDRIDRLKFASERSDDRGEELSQALATWEPLVTALAARIRIRPKARPRPEVGRSRTGPRGLANGRATLERDRA